MNAGGRSWAHRRGYIMPMVPILVFAMLGLVGIVYDGGRWMVTSREAWNVAHAAARTGAQQVDHHHYRATGQVRLDPHDAQTAVLTHVSAAGYHGMCVEVDGTSIMVVVTKTWEPTLLRLFAIGSKTASGSAHADAIRGVSGPDHAPGESELSC